MCSSCAEPTIVKEPKGEISSEVFKKKGSRPPRKGKKQKKTENRVLGKKLGGKRVYKKSAGPPYLRHN